MKGQRAHLPGLGRQFNHSHKSAAALPRPSLWTARTSLLGGASIKVNDAGLLANACHMLCIDCWAFCIACFCFAKQTADSQLFPLGVALLLSLDLTGAFDRVVPAWLLQDMRGSTIHGSIVKLMGSFISNRTTTICLPGYNTNNFPTHTWIL